MGMGTAPRRRGRDLVADADQDALALRGGRGGDERAQRADRAALAPDQAAAIVLGNVDVVDEGAALEALADLRRRGLVAEPADDGLDQALHRRLRRPEPSRGARAGT